MSERVAFGPGGSDGFFDPAKFESKPVPPAPGEQPAARFNAEGHVSQPTGPTEAEISAWMMRLSGLGPDGRRPEEPAGQPPAPHEHPAQEGEQQ